MAEELTFISGSKEEQYLSLLPQVRSLIEGEGGFSGQFGQCGCCPEGGF